MLGGGHHETDDFNMPPIYRARFRVSGHRRSPKHRPEPPAHPSLCLSFTASATRFTKIKNKALAITTLNMQSCCTCDKMFHRDNRKQIVRFSTPLLFLEIKFLIVQVSLHNASHKCNKGVKEVLRRFGNLAGLASIWQNAIKLCLYCMARVFYK